MITEGRMKEQVSLKDPVKLVMTSLMICLVLLGTVLFRIPIPMTQGYVHLGDAMVYLAVLVLGRRHGSAAASLGSALADVLGGFAFWAPWTLAVKFAMAYVTGSIIERSSGDRQGNTQASARMTMFRDISAMTAGGIVMCAGYLIAERIMYGSWAVAAISLPWNIGQFAVGIAVAEVIYPLLNKGLSGGRFF